MFLQVLVELYLNVVTDSGRTGSDGMHLVSSLLKVKCLRVKTRI